jgi:hypothetical protein
MNWKTILPWAIAFALTVIILIQNNRVMAEIKAIHSDQEAYASDADQAVRDAQADTAEIKEKLEEEEGE